MSWFAGQFVQLRLSATVQEETKEIAIIVIDRVLNKRGLVLVACTLMRI